jgi:oligosaccharyltransferase complex subunit delta (ribophorin II)
VNLAEGDNLKILLTTQDGKTAKRAHQTFLKLKDSATGLETSFPFIVKDSGKGKVELVKNLPATSSRISY